MINRTRILFLNVQCQVHNFQLLEQCLGSLGSCFDPDVLYLFLCVCVCSTEVLKDVTFTVEAGQTVALVRCLLLHHAHIPVVYQVLFNGSLVPEQQPQLRRAPAAVFGFSRRRTHVIYLSKSTNTTI